MQDSGSDLGLGLRTQGRSLRFGVRPPIWPLWPSRFRLRVQDVVPEIQLFGLDYDPCLGTGQVIATSPDLATNGGLHRK